MNVIHPSVVDAAKKSKLITCMITDDSPERCIATIRNATFDGADAFYLDITKLPDEFRNPDTLNQIFNYCEDKPIIVYCYRRANRPDMTDERIGDTLVMAVEAGASMCDVMGDLYDPSPLQLTMNPTAIEKQSILADRIHSAGGEVLLSSHIWEHRTKNEQLEHAKILAARNTDMIKIACIATSEDEMLDAFGITSELKYAINIPFIHICLGQYGKLHRAISPMLGASMCLCVERFNENDLKEQPLVRAERNVFNNLDWKMARDITYGTVHEKVKNYY